MTLRPFEGAFLWRPCSSHKRPLLVMLGMLLTFRLETCSLFLEALRHAPCWCWGRCWSNFLFVGSKSDGSKPARVWKTISGLARAAKHRQVSSQKVLQQMSNVTFGFSSEKKSDTVQQHPLRAPLLGQNTQVAFLGGACWSRACGRGGLWVGHFLFSALGWFAYPTGLLFVSAGWLICSFDLNLTNKSGKQGKQILAFS